MSATTFALGALSADWNQTGAFNISLNNVGAGLKMLENGASPTYFGIFDVADLSAADKTYTFPDFTGTVAVAATSTTTTQALFATATAGAPAYRAIADGDIPDTITINGTNNVSLASLATNGNCQFLWAEIPPVRAMWKYFPRQRLRRC